MSKKRLAQKAKENAALFAKIESLFNDAETHYNDVMNAMKTEADPAKKILALETLDHKIHRANRDINDHFDEFIEQRAKEGAKRTARTYAQRTAIVLGCATIIGGMIVAMDAASSIGMPDTRVMSWTSKKSKKIITEQETQSLTAASNIETYRQKLGEMITSGAQIKGELLKTADLQSLSDSPNFAEVFERYGSIRNRFAAAAAARAALGDAPAQAPQTKQKPTPKSAQRRVGTYDNLKNKV